MEKSIKQIDLLKSRRFFPLFLAQAFGAFNDNVFKNALVMLITYRLLSSTALHSQILITLAAGLFILPFFLFSATAGQFADKYEKSRLIVIIKFFEIIFMLLAIIGFFTQNIWMLMIVLFLLGAQATFFGPLKYAILPNLLYDYELIAGNGLIEAGTFLSILIGTILGGILILLSFGTWFISIAVCLIAILGFISSLYIPNTNIRNINLKVSYNFIQETINIIQYAKQRADIFLCILGISWFWVVGAIFLSEFPAFAKDILHANQYIVTIFIALFSIGIAIGSLLCNRLSQGKVDATYVPLGALGMTLFAIDFYFAAYHASLIRTTALMDLSTFFKTFTGWRISFDLIFIAIFGGLYTVPLYALLQYLSEPTHRARVIASNNVINALFMVIAAFLTIIILKIGFTILDLFLIIAVINGIVAIYICKLLPDLLVKSILRSMLQFVYHVKVNGLAHYHEAGKRLVIIANHTSFLDAVLLATFLPDRLTFAVDTFTAKKWWIKFFLYLVDTFPMHPNNPFAIKSLIDYVKQDKRCVIFPEGRLTMTGALMKIYEGPGLVTDKANAKLLPIRIQGAQLTIFSRLRGKVPIRFDPQITLTIFKAETLDVPPEIKGRQRRQIIGLQLYDLMRNMMFESSNYHQCLFYSLIDAKRMHGRRYKIVEDINRQAINYQQFITRSFILGRMIAKEKASQYVGILLPNANTTAILFFALHAYCRIPVMLNFSSGIRNILIACQTAKLSHVYTSSQFIRMAKLEECVETLEKNQITVHYLEKMRMHVSLFGKLIGLLQAQCPALAYRFINRAHPEKMGENESAVVLFTSGSEGTPKGIVLSHKNIQANRFQVCACVDFTINDKMLSTLPVFHAFGLTAGMILPILFGVKVFFYPTPLHYRIVPQLAYDINATILFGTDTFLSGYAKYAHPYDFYCIRYVFSGAEKLREQTLNFWARKFGVRIFDGYGATETSPIISMNTPMQNRVGTVGRLLPGMKAKLEAVPGITDGGRLLVSGPNVMKGYLLANAPGEFIPLSQEWYDTGDIVSMDESGFITIQGRVKRFAKIAGEMVSLSMVEQQINLLWPNHQHAVVSMPDPKKGEQLILVTNFSEASRQALVEFFQKNKLSEIAIPKRIIVLKSLPLLGSGKIDYSSLKDLLSKA